MPIPWLTVLQAVPWGEVVANAPKIAEGARKLWKTVRGGQEAATEASAPPAEAPASLPDASRRLVELERRHEALHAQLQESSALIKALAEQNTVLVRRIETNRRALRWLALGCVLSVALAVWALQRA